ncbi:MAG TPA: GNAT family N-acetyltransferase [Candidatus Limnocylindrales bacterium]|nr:GNAT family N-acetyltransferase [Candidatus Limnocylindrales bacterium]
MPVEIRRTRPDELLAWLDALSTTFLERRDNALVAEQVGPDWDFDRLWGAFDDGVVGTLRSWATEVTVPGGALVPATGIAAVTVLPTHRRQGILRRLMAAEHDAARERGELVAMLHASEAPIYGRFGYGVGVETCTWTLGTRATTFAGDRGSAGSVAFAPVDAGTRDLIRDIWDAYRRRHVGELRRQDFIFDFALGLRQFDVEKQWKGWVAVHRDADGTPDGYVRYTGEEHWEHHQPASRIDVQDFVWLTDDAYDGLWRFIASLDLVTSVRVQRRSPDERLPWLLANRRAAEIGDYGDALWVALLDLPRALTARSYDRAGEVVLEVLEAEPSTGRTRLRLETAPDGAACAVAGADPDLTLHADAIGAAYLGGTPLRRAVLARGYEEHRPGALDRADALFRTRDVPRASTFF